MSKISLSVHNNVLNNRIVAIAKNTNVPMSKNNSSLYDSETSSEITYSRDFLYFESNSPE